MFCKYLKSLVEAHRTLLCAAASAQSVSTFTCSDPPEWGRKGALQPFSTEEDFDRPASSRQAFHRWPFSALLFGGDFTFSGLRDEGHRTSRSETTHSGKKREKSGGQIQWLSTSYSTGAPLVLRRYGPQSKRVAPPFGGSVGHPDLPVIHYSILSGTEEEEEEEGEHQADTSRDKMVGQAKK